MNLNLNIILLILYLIILTISNSTAQQYDLQDYQIDENIEIHHNKKGGH